MNKFLLIYLTSILLYACNKEKKADEKSAVRIVCVSKQYNEIIGSLHAEKNLVATDLSSVYPNSINNLPKVGYHRALSAEAVLSQKPTLLIHDKNIGPDHVVKQLEKLKLPMMSFNTEANDFPSTYKLIEEIGVYFKRKSEAEKLISTLKKDIQKVDSIQVSVKKPRVVIIHFGQAKQHYLIVTKKSPAAKIIELAGGQLVVDGEKGMKILSPEAIATANPDVIFMTDYGYDRLNGIEGAKKLPGIALTEAAKNNRIYRLNEYDIMYLGPRSGKCALLIQQLLFPNERK